jgi:hypothetical protein
MSGVTIGPRERFGVGIVGTDVAHDLSFEIVSKLEDAASDQVMLDLRKPDFDLVEPRGVGGGVMDSDVWMLGQKHDDSLRLMSRKVVHDEMNFLVGRLGGNHVGQKGHKLRAGVTGGRLANPPGQWRTSRAAWSESVPDGSIRSRRDRRCVPSESALAKV